MSRAFVKDSDDAGDALPEIPLSEHPNYVTPRGLAQLRARLDAVDCNALQPFRPLRTAESPGPPGKEVRWAKQWRGSSRTPRRTSR